MIFRVRHEFQYWIMIDMSSLMIKPQGTLLLGHLHVEGLISSLTGPLSERTTFPPSKATQARPVEWVAFTKRTCELWVSRSSKQKRGSKHCDEQFLRVTNESFDMNWLAVTAKVLWSTWYLFFGLLEQKKLISRCADTMHFCWLSSVVDRSSRRQCNFIPFFPRNLVLLDFGDPTRDRDSYHKTLQL